MKNKLFIVIGAIVIVLAIVAAAIFLFSTKDMESATSEIDFKGTWKLFVNNTPISDEQYLVFGDEAINAYKNGDTVISGTYKIDKDTIILVDTDTHYKYEIITDNIVTMRDESATVYTMVRSTGDGKTKQSFDTELLVGEWEVKIHANGLAANEQMVLDKTNIKNFRDGNTTPVVDCAYTVSEDNMITLEGVGLTFGICYLDSDMMLLVESHTGFAYELIKK